MHLLKPPKGTTHFPWALRPLLALCASLSPLDSVFEHINQDPISTRFPCLLFVPLPPCSPKQDQQAPVIPARVYPERTLSSLLLFCRQRAFCEDGFLVPLVELCVPCFLKLNPSQGFPAVSRCPPPRLHFNHELWCSHPGTCTQLRRCIFAGFF